MVFVVVKIRCQKRLGAKAMDTPFQNPPCSPVIINCNGWLPNSDTHDKQYINSIVICKAGKAGLI